MTPQDGRMLLTFCYLLHSNNKWLSGFQLLGLLERPRILGLFRIFGCHLVPLFSSSYFDYKQRPHL